MKTLRALTIVLVIGLTTLAEHTAVQAKGSQWITIDEPNAVYQTYATGINTRGNIVGYYQDRTNNTFQGFLLTLG